MELGDAIRKSYITAGLAEEHLELLVSLGRMLEFESGDEIMRQFDTDRDLLILADGAAHIQGVLGEPIGFIKPGMPIGEISFLDSRPRSGTVIAKSPCRVVRLPAEPLLAEMSHFAELKAQILWNISQVLCARLRATNLHLEALMALDEADLGSSGTT